MTCLPPPRVALSRRVSVLARAALLFAAGASVFVSAARAQGATGSISGVVSDSAGRYLEGAEIAVAGTALRTTSEREGVFRISSVPAGTQSLTISYPGMSPGMQTVNVAAGQAAIVRATLNSDTIMLEAFTVATSKEGMAQAIALQKASFNQKLVAASDQFGDISEGNVGEYLKFLPGVGIDYTANDARAVSLRGMNPIFTTVTVDGGRLASGTSSNDNRRFELEQVAINSVETIEVFKTMTPDMAEDSTGGTVNLVSKSAFDRQVRTQFSYNLSLTANRDNLTLRRRGAWGEGKQLLVRPNADLNYSRRLSDQLGLNLSYRLSEITHDYPRAGYTWNYTTNGATLTNPYLASFQMYDEQKITHRESLSTKLDWRPGPQTKIAFTGQWNWYDLTFNGRSITYSSGTPAAGFTPNRVTSAPTTTGTGNGNVTTDVSQRNKYGPTYVLGTQFSHELGRGRLFGAYSWSQAENKYRDTTQGYLTSINLGLIRPAGSNTSVTMDNILTGRIPTFTVTQAAGAPDVRSLSNYSVAANSWQTRPFTSRDLKQGFDLAYRHAFDTTLPLAVQTGVRRDLATRKILRLGINHAHPALAGNELRAYRDDDYSGLDLGFGYGGVEWLSPYKTYRAFPNPANIFQTYLIRDVEETNDAAYARLDLNLTKQLTLVTGARYATRDLEAAAQDLRPVARQRLTVARLDYDGWYPSLNLKYTPRPDVVVRAGVSKTIGHPDIADIIPTVTDPDPASATSTGSISVPNPAIQPYRTRNYDLTGEWYFKSSGVISVSLFQKNVAGFISRGAVGLLSTLPNAAQLAQEYGISQAELSRYNVTFAQNGADSTVRGLELSYAQGLSFLPKPFNTLNVQANFTHIRISGDTHTVRLAQLQGATTESANVILGWRHGPLNVLATVNHTGEVETAFGATNTAPSTFNARVTKADVTVNYTVHPRATLYLQVRNLTGAGRSEYQTPSDPALFRSFRVPSRYSEYGDPIFYLGVRGRF